MVTMMTEHDDGDRQHAEARYCEVYGSWFTLGWPAASPAPPADSRSGTGRRRLIYPLLRWWGKLWLRPPAVTGIWPQCGRCVTSRICRVHELEMPSCDYKFRSPFHYFP